MRQLNRLVSALVMWFAVLLQADCVAQEFQNKFKPRVLYEHEVEQVPRGTPSMHRDIFVVRKLRAATLTRLGTKLLINDPANNQIIVVDTKTLAESQISLPVPAIDVQIESQTDMLFLDTYQPTKESEAIQSCYENLDALKKRQHRWMLLGVNGLGHFQQIRWLNEHQRFIVFSPNAHGIKPVVLFDHGGIKIAERMIEGCILGVDESANGFNIFYLEKNGNTQQLVQTQLDDDLNVVKTRKLPSMDRVQVPPGGPSLGVTQDFRLRGLKSGEVTKYFLDIATQPGYLDRTNRLPLAKYRSRFFNGNKLSAAESPLQPEIVVGSDSGLLDLDGFVLFDQQSNYYQVQDQRLTDAIFDDERKLVVTVGDTKKRGSWKVRLISFE